MSRKIYLHAGAHRTGTSSFQLCLAANRAQLQSEGYDVSYPGRDDAPGGTLHLRLPKPRHTPEEVRAFFGKAKRNLERQVTGEHKPLILSDENLPGLIKNFFSGKFYPNRRTRIRVFREALQTLDVKIEHVSFVVRPYDALFVSSYRKHAEDNLIEPFSALAPAMSGFTGGWPQTVQALRNVLKPAQLSVVEYGARGQSRDLLARLLGREASDFVEPAHNLNTSATDAAMEHLQKLYQSEAELEREDWQAIIKDFADQDEDRGFARFTPEQKAQLDARYEADLAALSQLDGVTFVTK